MGSQELLKEKNFKFRTLLNDMSGICHLIHTYNNNPKKLDELVGRLSELNNAILHIADEMMDCINDREESENNIVTEPDKNRPSILVAEDDVLGAQILTEILQDNGFGVKVAENGSAAVKLFDESTPGEFSVILMDTNMPKMNGCEAIRKIRDMKRRDAKSIPIFACTGSVLKDDIDKVRKSGANDYILKPLDINLFISKIQMACANCAS